MGHSVVQALTQAETARLDSALCREETWQTWHTWRQVFCRHHWWLMGLRVAWSRSWLLSSVGSNNGLYHSLYHGSSAQQEMVVLPTKKWNFF